MTGLRASTITYKMELFITALKERLNDNDEAIDGYNRSHTPLDHSTGFEYVAPAWVSFYWSTGTGTAMHDALIQRELDAQAQEWARQYPERPSLANCCADEDSPYSDEAQEWEIAALQDEAIYISATIEWREDADEVRIESYFMDQVNSQLNDGLRVHLTGNEFLTLSDEDCETLIQRLADAPYAAGEP